MHKSMEGETGADGGPVLVGGLSRSGKSLICSLLALHPHIAMAPAESNLWSHFYGRYGDLGQAHNLERCLDAMLQYEGLQCLDPDPDRIREAFWRGEATYSRLFALFYIHYAERLGKPRWGLQSVCLEFYAKRILAAYPSAQMIHMIRDPRDRYAHQRTTRESTGWRGKVGIATANWLYSVGRARSMQERHPQRYRVLRYETLVSHPEETIRELCGFLHEDQGPLVLAMGDTPRYKGRDLSPVFVGYFRQRMAGREVAFMQTRAKRDMALHGYELEPEHLSLGEVALLRLAYEPINLAYMAGWYIRKGLQLRFPAQLGDWGLSQHDT